LRCASGRRLAELILELLHERLHRLGHAHSLVVWSAGELVGGTMSNLFVVLDGRLLTPPVLGSGVRGVMREVVRREAAAGGIEMQERPLRRADLAAASEIFFTNVRLGAWPVAWCETGDVRDPDFLTARRRAEVRDQWLWRGLLMDDDPPPPRRCSEVEHALAGTTPPAVELVSVDEPAPPAPSVVTPATQRLPPAPATSWIPAAVLMAVGIVSLAAYLVLR
jgi:hypothetical protein